MNLFSNYYLSPPLQFKGLINLLQTLCHNKTCHKTCGVKYLHERNMKTEK